MHPPISSLFGAYFPYLLVMFGSEVAESAPDRWVRGNTLQGHLAMCIFRSSINPAISELCICGSLELLYLEKLLQAAARETLAESQIKIETWTNC